MESIAPWVYAIDIFGTFVFAISGALAASEKRFDVFGAGILALVTAVGRGTLRDVLSNVEPLIFRKEIYTTACLAGGYCS